jgi:hypothetical protein
MNQKNLGNENLRGFEKLKKKQKKNNKKRDWKTRGENQN